MIYKILYMDFYSIIFFKVFFKASNISIFFTKFNYYYFLTLSFQSDEDFQERKREVENIMKKNADWIWDWSSRPENSPPK